MSKGNFGTCVTNGQEFSQHITIWRKPRSTIYTTWAN